jgi:PhnB protein
MSDTTQNAVTVHEVFAYLSVRGAADAISFYERAFGATEIFRLEEPSGRIGHAEVKIGPATVMLADEFPEFGFLGPQSLGGTCMCMHLHVENVDAMMQRALDAGATLVRAAKDEFYGERSGKVRDPFGHEWMLGQHIEDVTPEEMQRRYTALLAQGS